MTGPDESAPAGEAPSPGGSSSPGERMVNLLRAVAWGARDTARDVRRAARREARRAYDEGWERYYQRTRRRRSG